MGEGRWGGTVRCAPIWRSLPKPVVTHSEGELDDDTGKKMQETLFRKHQLQILNDLPSLIQQLFIDC